MGGPHGGAFGYAVQSDFIPQWLGLAARQRGDSAGSRSLRSQIQCAADLQGTVSGCQLYGPAAASRTLLRVCLAAANRTDALSGCLRPSGLGKRYGVRVVAGESRSE